MVRGGIDGPRRRRLAGRGVVAATLVTGSVVAGTGAFSADDLTDAQHQRSQLGGTIQNLQQQLSVTKDQESQLTAQVAELDSQIIGTQQHINAQQQEVDKIQADLDAATAKLADTRARMKDDKARLAKEMVFVYKESLSSTLVNNLVGSDNFNDFWVQVIGLRRITAAEQTMVDAVRQEEADVTALVAQKNADKQEKKAALQQLQASNNVLHRQRKQREDTEQHLQQVQADDQLQLQQDIQSAAEVDQQIAQIEAARAAAAAAGSPGLALGHGFSWPEPDVSGSAITQVFGCTGLRIEPPYQGCAHFHAGIDIAGPSGTSVVAAANGVAHKFPGTYGYGNHVIIDHLNGWMSLYGHLSGFSVSDGANVNTGQQIGSEGSTGNSTGPHLHFEIRFHNAPENPQG